MGKLLTGHYGRPPEAESVPLPLNEASQKLGLRPSDFVSEGPPRFFEKSFGAPGRYLVFQTDLDEVQSSPVWKVGYYLLPLGAADVLKALDKSRMAAAAASAGHKLPVEVECEATPPPEIQKRLDDWIAHCQPLFFQCGCTHLELRVYSPWGLRRRWKARLRCPKRCQPALIVQI